MTNGPRTFMQAQTTASISYDINHRCAATFLCSPFAGNITCHTLEVDGGNWLRRRPSMPEFKPIREAFATWRPGKCAGKCSRCCARGGSRVEFGMHHAGT